ncbi:MAG: TetR/AcrR family transcriptional regulator [Rubrobacteraceae bacterium]
MARRVVGGESDSLTMEDWVAAARRAISEGGIGAVAVEPLAQSLGVTKGSFYWHFPNRGALLRATLEQWEEEATGAVISATEKVDDPRERLVRLVEEAFTGDPLGTRTSGREVFLGHAFELAVSDAADDPGVKPYLHRVSERRIDYLQECYRALGISPEEAKYRALLAYAAYVGTLRLIREAPNRIPWGEEYHGYRQQLISTLVPARDTGVSE